MLAEWWNGVELWVLALSFPFQFALVMAVLAPVCLVVAYLIDRVVDHASAWFGPSPTEDRPIRTGQVIPEQPASDRDGDEDGDEDGEQERVPAATAGR